MTLFLIAAAVLLLAVLVVLLRPLVRKSAPRSKSVGAGESPALKILREQKADLEAERAAGRVSDAQYAETIKELERRALDESEAPEQLVSQGARKGVAIAVAVLVPLAAAGLYWQIGNPDGLDPAKLVAADQHEMSSSQMNAMVEKLATKVKANPDDLEGAQMLGRSYMVLERFDEATAVFEQVSKKLPDDAQVMADWADALASKQGGKLQGEPEKIIAKALKLDPKNVKALALAGSAGFEKQDYKGALVHWEKLAELADPSSEFGRSVRSMIDEARAKAGMPRLPEAPVQAQAQMPSQAQPPAAAGATGELSVSGRLQLDPALQSSVSPDDVLFVFVRSPAGGPPLSGLRFKASELPIDFNFAGAPQMMAGGALPEKVIVGARISKSGDVKAAPGDLQGFSEQVKPDAKGVKLTIKEVVR